MKATESQVTCVVNALTPYVKMLRNIKETRTTEESYTIEQALRKLMKDKCLNSFFRMLLTLDKIIRDECIEMIERKGRRSDDISVKMLSNTSALCKECVCCKAVDEGTACKRFFAVSAIPV